MTENTRLCYRCQAVLEDKISFRSLCPKCGTDLHVCLSCRFYLPGKPSDCLIPEIDKITDKEKNNFCEEFSYQTAIKSQPVPSQEAVVKKLFKEEKLEKPKKFTDLFPD
ncbi:MAG: hypothetical protein WC371_01285 [Parachlamydiales bacterium]